MGSTTGTVLILAFLVPLFGLVASPIWLRFTCDFLGFPGDASPRRAFRARDLERVISKATQF
jgi:hypothetical protein